MKRTMEIVLCLLVVLVFAEFSQIAPMQQVSATSEFSGYATLVIKQKSDGVVLASSSPQWFETDPVWIWVAVVAIVAFTAVAVVAILKKDVNKGQGYIQADLKVTKANGDKVEASVKAGSETIIAEIPITSMSQEGHWTFELAGIPYKSVVGGIVISVDKFGLLAPYIGLASTAIIGAVATAVYVKRAKRRKEKQ